MIELGALALERVTYFVLDEADMMLQMGFEEQLGRLVAAAPAAGALAKLARHNALLQVPGACLVPVRHVAGMGAPRGKSHTL